MGRYSNGNHQIERLEIMENELYEESYKNPKHFSFGKIGRIFSKISLARESKKLKNH
jgi:hypothetical protein